MLRVLVWVIRRDLRLILRRPGEVLTTLFFFVMVSTLVPLGVGSAPDLLRELGPGVIWIASLLASMLSLGRLFEGDHADGTLEQWVLSAEPLSVLVVGKVLAHWIATGLPLLLLSPFLALQFGLSFSTLEGLLAGLILGTPVLSLVGAIGSALTLGVRGGGMLVSLLVLPLYVPVLIFGAAAAGDGGRSANLLLLGGLLSVSLALAPWAISVALRIALE